MRSTQLLATVFALSSLSNAWPWPANLINRDQVDRLIFGRADGGNNDKPQSTQASATPAPKTNAKSSAAATTGKSASQSGASKTASGSGADKTGASKSGASETDKGSKTSSELKQPSGAISNKYPPGKSFGPTIPPGGVSILTPAATSGPQYFKIGDYVTFGWNYTSLKVTPTKIDVMATCTLNQAMYTIAENQTAHTSGLAVWDTKKDTHGKAPLVMASYTLIIKAAGQATDAVAKPGYLTPNEGFMFAMYSPQAYTPLSSFDCATCQSLASLSARETLSLVFGTAALTILSFGWFAHGLFGLF